MSGLRKLVESNLGQALQDEEYRVCLGFAKRKLEGIIEREGDDGGERRKVYYLAILVAETVELSRWTLMSLEEGCINGKAHRPGQEACALLQ